MEQLKLHDYIRFALQALALAGGCFGLLTLYIGLGFLFATGANNFALRVIFALMMSTMGIYLIFTAYIMLKKFSIGAIKFFCFALAYFFFDGLMQLVEPVADVFLEKQMRLEMLGITFVPLLSAIVVYSLCVKVLVKLTKAQ